MNLGISGRITRATIASPLTPLFLLAAILVGLIATIITKTEMMIAAAMTSISFAMPRQARPDRRRFRHLPCPHRTRASG